MSSSVTGRRSACAVAEAADADAIVVVLQALSPMSRYFRFLGYPSLTPSRIQSLIASSDGAASALVAEAGGRIVAFAGFHRDAADPERAEVAFAVADAAARPRYRNAAAGTPGAPRPRAAHHPLRRLRDGRQPQDARRLSRFRFRGDDHPGRWALPRVGRSRHDRGLPGEGGGTVPGGRRRVDEGVLRAAGGGRRGRQPSNAAEIGSEILHNLRDAGFTGRIVPVHPTAAEIGGLPAYAHVQDIDGPVDLAIVVVPAAQVLAAVDDCIAKHVRAICVISAGFSECDADGRAREAALLERVRAAGCRLIGPNCMGLLNTDPAVRLNATFSPVYPPAGNVAMSTQSGALGLAILDYARRLRHRDFELRVRRQQGRRLRQRSDSVLGGRSADRRHPALPRELRESSKVQRDCPPRRPHASRSWR